MRSTQSQQHGSVLPLHFRPATWSEKLGEACTEPEIVEVVREFIAELTPDDIARIPPHVRPGRFIDATDVTAYGLDLVRYECEDNDGRRVVQQLARFFSAASIRLSEILVESRETGNSALSD